LITRGYDAALHSGVPDRCRPGVPASAWDFG
jgi:hypothetical protein